LAHAHGGGNHYFQLWDVGHGEWAKRSLRVMLSGVMILILSVAVISYGLYRLQLS